ncbi:MAG: hypothetical protein KC549_02825 [Myxococcales bacterium]|nr:hypothetical protein [Myxococcales bacterium]MCB9545751.1 hypothetical protein [Myxococcales bacterium]
MKPALLLCLLSLSACTTTLTVESEVPGVTVSDVTFTTKNRTYLAPEQLLPGQKTSEIMIFVDDEDEPGHLAFVLEKDGRRVALEVEAPVRARPGEDTVYTLRADTPVKSALLSEAPMALWADVPLLPDGDAP